MLSLCSSDQPRHPLAFGSSSASHLPPPALPPISGPMTLGFVLHHLPFPPSRLAFFNHLAAACLIPDALHRITDDFSVRASHATATSTSTSLPHPVPTTQLYLPPCLQIQALPASWIRPSPPPSPLSPFPSTHSPPDGKALHPLHLISSKPLIIAGFHMDIASAIRSPGCHRPPLRPLVLESREMEDSDQGGRRSLDPSHCHLLPSAITHHGGAERVGGDE